MKKIDNMPQINIVLQGTYEHYKNKKLYEVIAIARHSETHEEMVIYKALYDCEKFGKQQIWARPATMFLEKVLHNEQMVPRFKLISSEMQQA